MSTSTKRSSSLSLLALCLPVLLLVQQGLQVQQAHAHSQIHAQSLELMDRPPFHSVSVPPNLVITFDDSSSMFNAFTPDTLGEMNQHTLNAVKSSHYNKLYYDPEIYYEPAYDASGVMPNADFNNAQTDPFIPQQSDSVDLSVWYKVPWSTSTLTTRYVPFATNQNGDTAIVPAFYFVFDASLDVNNCVGSSQERQLLDACYRYVQVTATSGSKRLRPELGDIESSDERVNFANWYQYYSLKVLRAKTLTSRLIGALGSAVKVARQTVNVTGPVSGSLASPINTVRSIAEERADLLTWLFAITEVSGTPLRRAYVEVGDFFKASGGSNPYYETPWQTDKGEQLACVVNHHLVVSDGMWSNTDAVAAINSDNQTITLPDGETYRPEEHKLYAFGQSTLADISFSLWATDLRPGFLNATPALVLNREASDPYWDHRNDPATWQHLSNHAISLAGPGLISPDPATITALIEGRTFTNLDDVSQVGWSVFDPATTHGDLAKIDDLFHATLNGRGQFFDATNQTEIFSLLDGFSSSVTSERFLVSSLAINTTSIAPGAVAYQARFDIEKNIGHLLAIPLEGGCEFTNLSACTPSWDAFERNQDQPAKDRMVYTYNPEIRMGQRGRPFAWTHLNADQQTILNKGDNQGKQRLNYIRGDRSREESQGGNFKNRSSAVLGPIVNSSPVLVSNGFNANGSQIIAYPDDLELGTNTYRKFLCDGPVDSNADGLIDSCASGIFNRKPVVYVGSNDGMLHAYDARVPGGGNELFSYVPNIFFDKLPALSDPAAASQAMVDGELVSADVFYQGGWHTVLVGGLRSGGQGFFALDVTRPKEFTSASSRVNRLPPEDRVVRWEFSDKDDVDMGYSYAKPIIVKSNYTDDNHSTGRWVAIFGNGYNSAENDGRKGSGEAVLFVVDVETGKLLKKITTGVGSSNLPNGLATPAVIFSNADLKADYAYAGDLQGNLWKFDLSSEDPDDWQLAYDTPSNNPDLTYYVGVPLFLASDASGARQAITAAPMVGPHPAGLGGKMIYFGTGKFLEDTDQSTTAIQSFYALWDQDICLKGSEQIACVNVDVSGDTKLEHVRSNNTKSQLIKSELLQQKITQESDNQRVVSSNAIDWESHRGWRIDLDQEPGERVLLQPVIVGPLVFFATYVPTLDGCSVGGHSWLFGLDKTNGGSASFQVFDFNNDGLFDKTDYLGDSRTSAKKLTTPAIGLMRIGCGDGNCIASGEVSKVSEGLNWGRWRWRILSE